MASRDDGIVVMDRYDQATAAAIIRERGAAAQSLHGGAAPAKKTRGLVQVHRRDPKDVPERERPASGGERSPRAARSPVGPAAPPKLTLLGLLALMASPFVALGEMVRQPRKVTRFFCGPASDPHTLGGRVLDMWWWFQGATRGTWVQRCLVSAKHGWDYLATSPAAPLPVKWIRRGLQQLGACLGGAVDEANRDASASCFGRMAVVVAHIASEAYEAVASRVLAVWNTVEHAVLQRRERQARQRRDGEAWSRAKTEMYKKGPFPASRSPDADNILGADEPSGATKPPSEMDKYVATSLRLRGTAPGPAWGPGLRNRTKTTEEFPRALSPQQSFHMPPLVKPVSWTAWAGSLVGLGAQKEKVESMSDTASSAPMSPVSPGYRSIYSANGDGGPVPNVDIIHASPQLFSSLNGPPRPSGQPVCLKLHHLGRVLLLSFLFVGMPYTIYSTRTSSSVGPLVPDAADAAVKLASAAPDRPSSLFDTLSAEISKGIHAMGTGAASGDSTELLTLRAEVTAAMADLGTVGAQDPERLMKQKVLEAAQARVRLLEMKESQEKAAREAQASLAMTRELEEARARTKAMAVVQATTKADAARAETLQRLAGTPNAALEAEKAASAAYQEVVDRIASSGVSPMDIPPYVSAMSAGAGARVMGTTPQTDPAAAAAAEATRREATRLEAAAAARVAQQEAEEERKRAEAAAAVKAAAEAAAEAGAQAAARAAAQAQATLQAPPAVADAAIPVTPVKVPVPVVPGSGGVLQASLESDPAGLAAKKRQEEEAAAKARAQKEKEGRDEREAEAYAQRFMKKTGAGNDAAATPAGPTPTRAPTPKPTEERFGVQYTRAPTQKLSRAVRDAMHVAEVLAEREQHKQEKLKAEQEYKRKQAIEQAEREEREREEARDKKMKQMEEQLQQLQKERDLLSGQGVAEPAAQAVAVSVVASPTKVVGKDNHNVHIVWTSFQQAEGTKGIMGGAHLAKMRLLQLQAFTIPSLVRNFNAGARFVWLVYYDGPGTSSMPEETLQELKDLVDALPFAATLEAPVKDTGASQKYSFSGGGQAMQHKRALLRAIEEGAFRQMQPAPTPELAQEALSFTMTFIKAGNAFPKRYMKEIQGRIQKWEERVRFTSESPAWPPEVSGLAQGQWPTSDAPEGSMSEPSILFCAWHSISWQDATGTKAEDVIGALGPSKHERRCIASGLTVHQRSTDSASKIVHSKIRPAGSQRTTWYQGMEVQYLDRSVIGLIMDKAIKLPGFIASVDIVMKSFGCAKSHLMSLNGYMVDHASQIESECQALGTFFPCTGFTEARK